MKTEVIDGEISRSNGLLELGGIHTTHDGVQMVLRCGDQKVTVFSGGNGSYENDPQEFIVFAMFGGSGLSLSEIKILSINTVRNRRRPAGQKSSVEIHLEYKGEKYSNVADGPNLFRATARAVLEIINESIPK